MTAEVQPWAQQLLDLHSRLEPLFKRPEPRARALGYLQGLLSNVERKNSWQLAEFIDDTTPDGVQHLLERAHWNADLARDILRDYVVGSTLHLLDASPGYFATRIKEKNDAPDWDHIPMSLWQ